VDEVANLVADGLLPVGQRIDVPVNAGIAVIRGRGHDSDSISNVLQGAPTKAECRLPRRSQTTAAPPERVSDSLTNEGGAVMPRGYGLSEVTKDAIWKLRAEGLSDREIGRRSAFPGGA